MSEPITVGALAMIARHARQRRRAARLALERAQLELLAANVAADVAERELATAISAAVWQDGEAVPA